MSILLQKNVGDYSYMSSPNIYYRAKKTQLSFGQLRFYGSIIYLIVYKMA